MYYMYISYHNLWMVQYNHTLSFSPLVGWLIGWLAYSTTLRSMVTNSIPNNRPSISPKGTGFRHHLEWIQAFVEDDFPNNYICGRCSINQDIYQPLLNMLVLFDEQGSKQTEHVFDIWSDAYTHSVSIYPSPSLSNI